MVDMIEPYIAGYLAFREVPFFINLLKKLENTKPKLIPQVILLDGNGMLHYSGFGIACHLGVLSDIPTIGVAKNLLNVDGLCRDEDYKIKVESLKKAGESFELISSNGKCLGLAYKSTDVSTKPIYISVGHLISINTAKWIVSLCTKHRIPEPTRHADIESREVLRVKFPPIPSVKQGQTKKQKEKLVGRRDQEKT